MLAWPALESGSSSRARSAALLASARNSSLLSYPKWNIPDWRMESDDHACTNPGSSSTARRYICSPRRSSCSGWYRFVAWCSPRRNASCAAGFVVGGFWSLSRSKPVSLTPSPAMTLVATSDCTRRTSRIVPSNAEAQTCAPSLTRTRLGVIRTRSLCVPARSQRTAPRRTYSASNASPISRSLRPVPTRRSALERAITATPFTFASRDAISSARPVARKASSGFPRFSNGNTAMRFAGTGAATAEW